MSQSSPCPYCQDTRKLRLPALLPVTTEPSEAALVLSTLTVDCPVCTGFQFSDIEPVYAAEHIPALTQHRDREGRIDYIKRRLATQIGMFLLSNGFMRETIDEGQPYRDQDEARIELRVDVVRRGQLGQGEQRDNEIRLACLDSFKADIRREMMEQPDKSGWWRANAELIDHMIESVYQRIRTQLEQDNAQAEQIDSRDAAAQAGHE